MVGALVLGVVLLAPAYAAAADEAFIPPTFSANVTGDIVFASNTLMSCANPPSTSCTNARNGTGGGLSNNDHAMRYVDVDGNSGIGTGTFNSSSSELSIPAGATVLFAGLYWGGDTNGSGSNAPPDRNARGTASLRVPGAAAYQSVTGAVTDSSSQTRRYQAFEDITSIVQAAGGGTYTVGNVQAGLGDDHYAGWTIVVAYSHPDEPPRNLTIYDGLQSVRGSTPLEIDVSGFRTPPTGPVRTNIGFVTYEGDLGITGDSAELETTTLGDAQNDDENFFNSSISREGSRVSSKSPDYVNQLGYDADIVNADNILANNATSATITLRTSGDVYMPGVITFATELFAPRVELTKTVNDLNGGDVEPGDVLEYVVDGVNAGDDAAVGFTLRDSIPANTTYVPGSITFPDNAGGPTGPRTDAAGDDTAEYEGGPNRITARVGTGASATTGGRIAAGEDFQVRFRVQVASQLAEGTQIPNTASATYFSESLNTPLSASDDVSVTVAAPDLDIDKVRNGPLVPGSSGSYTITVDNDGNAPIRGTETVVTDTLPADLTPTAVSGPGWTCDPIAGQSIRCERNDDLAPGAAFPPLTLTVDVDPGATGVIENTAVVANPADANPANDSSTDPAPPAPSADLSISKTAADDEVVVGDTVVYTLAIHNDGPSTARNVAVLDSLATGLTFVSAVPSQGTCNAVISCALGDLAVGGDATVTITATATAAAAGTDLSNTARVSGDQPDPDPDNDEDTTIVEVGSTDLAITKSIDDDTPTAGGPVQYTLVVTNNGPSGATSIAVHDSLPADLTAISTDRSECTVVGRDIDCAFPSLANGATETIVVDATVPASQPAGALDNTASVNGAEPDTDPTNDTSTVEAVVGTAADLSITKVANADPVEPGELLTYTLTVTNDGPSDAANVTISDPLPAGTSFESADAGCTEAAGTVTCAVGPLADGASTTREVVVRVDADQIGNIANTATVDSDTPDPDPDNNDDSTTTTVVSSADLSLAKTASPANAAPGDTVTYELTVTNDGPASAAGVVLTEPLPPGVTFVDSTPGAPGCEFASGTVSCELGTIPSGESRTVIVRATVDPVASTPPTAHQHLIPVEKVELQVDLEVGETETITLSCPQAGQVMVDGSVRADAVDQGTGTLPDIETHTSQSASPGSYEFTVTNNAGGRAQAKVFGVCIPAQTGTEAGHTHPLLVSDPPVSVTAPLTPGRHELSVSCGPGFTAVAPGIDVSSGSARLVASEPLPDGGRRFVVEAEGDAAVVTVSTRCLANQVGTTDGHSHELGLTEVVRTVSVPANSTVSETVTCADDAKGIVASYELAPGLISAGNDPQPKSRVFKLVNPTSGPLEATIDLLCLGDRTGPPVLIDEIVNSASVSSTTTDPDTADHVASASVQLAAGPPPPPPPPPGPIAPPVAPPGGPGPNNLGTPSLGDAPAVLDLEGGRAVGVPVVCGVADCSGSLVLRAVKSRGKIDKGDRLGKAPFEIEPGSARVEVRVRRAAARLAARGKLRRIKAVMHYDAASGTERVARVLKLRR